MQHVLIVEDDPLTQEIVSSILQSQDLQADVASDGFAALRLLRETPYELALIDYHLPEMDGYALARLMQDISAERGISLRLVAMTADRHGLLARRGIDDIFDAILAKPFDPLELIKLLRTDPSVAADQQEPLAAAASLLADLGADRARLVAASFWRKRGVYGLPKVAVFPSPTADQASAITMCFDVVDRETAELLLLLDAGGLQELIRSCLDETAVALPVVSLDKSLAAVSDACFIVADPASWSAIASLLKTKRAREGEIGEFGSDRRNMLGLG